MSAFPARLDFNQTPLVVIWELTRACALACKHCRAEANPHRSPLELTFAEGCQLMDQVKELGAPVFVMTGGDPAMRPDFYDLVAYGTKIGLRVSASPSGTKLMTRENLKRAAEAGLQRASFSFDGSNAAIHDSFRGVKNSFQWTVDAVRYAQEAGIQTQINTTVHKGNLHDLPALAHLVEELDSVLWSVFFLVPTGRGQLDDIISPEEHEEVLNWLYDLSGQVSFPIKTTEAPWYRRIAMQRAGIDPANLQAGVPIAAFSGPKLPAASGPRDRGSSLGVNDGKGFVFISHTGEVTPSGFLPLAAGNIREQTLADLYRHSELFVALRDPDRLQGKCGVCPYRQVCGGSRARAYAITGDYLASEPYCTYLPPGI